jgi:hypothetical protein
VVRRAHHERIYSQPLRSVQRLAPVQGLTPVQGSKFKVQRNIQSGSRRSRNCHARSQRELPCSENSRNVERFRCDVNAIFVVDRIRLYTLRRSTPSCLSAPLLFPTINYSYGYQQSG